MNRSAKPITEPRSLVSRTPIRLAMLGMVDGNGHPYSWSAIFNGYDREAMAECPYPAIPAYLDKQPPETLRIPGAQVTHIWTDDPADAQHVAECSLIPNVVSDPTDVIDKVDAVVIATDKGHEHVERCRPFVEAGLPVFVDKPLVDNAEDLETVHNWVNAGHAIMSSSALRYSKELMPYRTSTAELGDLRFVSVMTPKTWERYGIHALEAVYPVLGPGFISARNTGDVTRNVVHLKHKRGVDVVVVASADIYRAFGVVTLCGTAEHIYVKTRDTFHAFRRQLEAFIDYLKTGIRPFPFSETEELMKLVIAGIRSREDGGREVPLTEI